MLQIKNVSFGYQKDLVLQNINLTIETGKQYFLIGESGCGKSTLLKLIYGLYDIKIGSIQFNNEPILGPSYNLIPGMDYMKYLAQDFDLMPFITVAENVGKHLSNTNKEQKYQRINELLEVVEMVEFTNVKAKNLSGGQMQRVAIARALALQPKVLLLDEPFSHIDNFRKNSLRRKLYSYFKKQNITTITATHDSEEVKAFAEEIAVLKEGKIVEVATPNYLFNRKKSNYITSLLSEVNTISNSYFNLDNKTQKPLLLYPHELQIVEKSKLKVVVLKSYFYGSYFLIETSYEDGVILFQNPTEIELGKELYLNIKSSENSSPKNI
jgi:ABC-type Fe3+/spermidine/putrescine transport system ATPase subunit